MRYCGVIFVEHRFVYDTETVEDILRSFLRKKERVLLCFPREGSAIGPVLEAMITRCEGVAVFWEGELSWKNLLRISFQQRCSAVIGGPEIILSLSKLAKRLGTPLYIRNALLVGEKPEEWLVEYVESSLDCSVRGCYCHLEERILEPEIEKIRQELCRWTSVLDFKLEKTGAGLSLEMIVFPKERLPKLPNFARLVVSGWDGDRDGPLNMPLLWKNVIYCRQNH